MKSHFVDEERLRKRNRIKHIYEVSLRRRRETSEKTPSRAKRRFINIILLTILFVCSVAVYIIKLNSEYLF
jgi:hypothetical protein